MGRRAKLVRILLPACLSLLSLVQVTVAQPSASTTPGGSSRFNTDVSMDDEESLELLELRRMLDSDEDQMIIWKVESGEPIQTEATDFSTFRSDKNYIIIQGRSKVKPEHWNVFYWIGRESSDTDAGDAASFTVLLDAIVHSTINIRREPEGHESHVFKKTFGREYLEDETRHLDPSMPETSVAKPSIPRLFLIRGQEQIRFKEAGLSLSYAEDSSNCIVFNAEIVYVYCGKRTSEPQRSVAKELANMIIEKLKPEAQLKIIMRTTEGWTDAPPGETDATTDFFQEFENYPDDQENRFESVEYDSSEDMATEFDRIMKLGDNDDLTVIRIHEENNGVVRDHIVDEKPVPISSLQTDDCYVIDTRESVGLLVWLGMKSEIDEREESARKAELYLREKGYGHNTPINFVDQEAVVLPPEAHLGDFIHFMKNLNDSPSPSVGMRLESTSSVTVM